MLRHVRCLPRFVAAVVLAAALVLSAAPELWAEGARLKNGLSLDGKLVPIQGLTSDLIRKTQGNTIHHPILMVHTAMQRIFVPDRQVAEVNREPDLAKWEVFKLPAHKRGARRQMLAQLGSIVEQTEFDEFGRRILTVMTATERLPIIQGITQIDPRFVSAEGLTHQWQCAYATSSLDPRVLDAMLRKAIKPDNPEDRLSIARFYVQASLFMRAAAELDSIVRDFPDWKDRVGEILLSLRTEQARQLLGEIRHRKAAGQYLLAWQAVRQFPTDGMSASVLRDLQQLGDELIRLRDRRDEVLVALGELQAELPNEELVERVRPLRSVVREQLDFDSLDRMNAFLELKGDNTLRPEQRLALAYSGWVVGSANAVTDLDLTLRLWQARFLVLDSLRCDDPPRQKVILSELRALEGVGPERVGQLIPLLPPVLETPYLQSGTPLELEAPGPRRADPVVKYTALLPPEYSPHRAYPVIIALRPAETDRAGIVQWWGGNAEKPGQAQRHGYIVIAPDYSSLKSGLYDYSAAAHDAVESALRDARKRFSIDSDRVFLAGHGAGGDAAYDIGMSHPDLFAGVIAVNGLCDKYCTWYWQNAKNLPIYAIGGELSRGSLADQDHARNLNRMMTHGYDLIYAEYIGRGYESYFSEIHRLFDWMALHRRAPYPQEIDAEVLRPHDNHFYWVTAEGLPRATQQSIVLTDGPRGPVRPMELKVKIADGSDDYTAVYVTSGADHNTLWLSPRVISFDKRLVVNYAGRRRYSDFPERDLATLLDDLRVRGDRQMLFWAKVEL